MDVDGDGGRTGAPARAAASAPPGTGGEGPIDPATERAPAERGPAARAEIERLRAENERLRYETERLRAENERLRAGGGQQPSTRQAYEETGGTAGALANELGGRVDGTGALLGEPAEQRARVAPELAAALLRLTAAVPPVDRSLFRGARYVRAARRSANRAGVDPAAPDPARPDPAAPDPATVDAERRPVAPGPAAGPERKPTASVAAGSNAWTETVAAVLERIPGSVAVLAPLTEDGRVVDYIIQAVSPEALDVEHRTPAQLVGKRMLAAYPALGGSDLLDVYREVLDSGASKQIVFTHTDLVNGRPASTAFRLCVHRFGPGLIVSWVCLEGERRSAAWLDRIQRLAGLGWANWDLVADRLEWSDHLYAVFGRDPGDGPIRLDDLPSVVVPADLPALQGAISAIIDGSETADTSFRVNSSQGLRHLRCVLHVVRDPMGVPASIGVIAQDITSRELAVRRLKEAERQLADRQRLIEAEHRLAEELRQIILPLPAAPLSLPGLRVAVRYLPAEQSSRVGGDWYHATALPDGTSLLAVGDVAGHGLAAAAIMAELRHALATLTLTSTAEPGELLAYLNRLLCDRQGARPITATALIARFDQSVGELVWAQAGHPAPLLARGNLVAELPRPSGILLGAARDARYATSSLTLTPHDILLLFTDGLIEPHGGGPEDGLGAVIEVLTSSAAAGAGQSLTHLLMRLPPANPMDDTCILAARATVAGVPAGHLVVRG